MGKGDGEEGMGNDAGEGASSNMGRFSDAFGGGLRSVTSP